MGEFEKIGELDDFLRRRAFLAQVERRDDLRGDPGVTRVAEILFGKASGPADLTLR